MIKSTSNKDKKNDKEDKFDTNQDSSYSNDVVFEEVDTGLTKIKNVQEKLKICKKERQEYLDGWQRAKADFINAQKNFEFQKHENATYTIEKIMEDILPVVDSFDMAISDKKVWESVDKNWRVGVEYIYSQLLSVLKNNGVVQFNPLGDTFDPAHHTSIEQVNAETSEEDHVITKVIQKGYRLNDKLLRPPKVVVAIWDSKK